MARPRWAAVGRRRSEDRGAAALEFAILLVPLMLIIFGIVSYGVMLSFRQSMSQAATEGARAAAVQLNEGDRAGDAMEAVNSAMQAAGIACGEDSLACEANPATDCDGGPTGLDTSEYFSMKLTYQYQDNPIVPSVPLIEETLPDDLCYMATVRIS